MSGPVSMFVAGLVLLAVCGEMFARGLGWVAKAGGREKPYERYAVAAVSFAVPVVAVALAAGLSGYPRVALATVIGANVANLGLVLGLAAAARPLEGRSPLHRGGIPAAIGSAFLVWFLARDNGLSRADGAGLIAAFVVICAALVRVTRDRSVPERPAPPAAGAEVGCLGAVLLFVGIAGILSGGAIVARFLPGMVRVTGLYGVSLALVGIGIGATFRNVLEAASAARRGDGDAVLAGVAGGSVVNLLLGIGVVAAVKSIPVPDRLVRNELPVLAISSLLLVPVLANGLRVRRWEGLALYFAYAGFVGWVVGRPGSG